MAHHRFSVTISLTADVQVATQNTQIPSDQAVTATIANHLNGLDVGNGYTVSAATVTTYTKKLKK